MEFRKVLIIEDNVINSELLVEFLKTRYDVQLEIAEDGSVALNKVKEFLPDLILLDIQLPGLDGYEILRMIKDQKQFRDVPVIGVTAYAMKGDRDKILEAGFDEYLAKPVKMNELFKKIEMVIAR